eukprot:gene12439-8528_t
MQSYREEDVTPREDLEANSVELYKRYCEEEQCKPNSAFIMYLQDRGSSLQLEKLSFSFNYLGPKGLVPIIRLVDRCQTLMTLDLENNGADNNTVNILCEVLERHLGLAWLSLRGNPITQKGGRRLLQMVQANPRITYIDVSATDIYEAVQQAIYATVERHRHQRDERTGIAVADDATRKCAEGILEHLPPLQKKKEYVAIRQVDHLLSGAASGSGSPKSGKAAGAGGLKRPIAPPRRPTATRGGAADSHLFLDGALNEGGDVDDAESRGPTKRMPADQIRKLREKFAERARLHAELQRSDINRTANRVRMELMTLERNCAAAVTTSLPPIDPVGAGSRGGEHGLGAILHGKPPRPTAVPAENSVSDEDGDREEDAEGSSEADRSESGSDRDGAAPPPAGLSAHPPAPPPVGPASFLSGEGGMEDGLAAEPTTTTSNNNSVREAVGPTIGDALHPAQRLYMSSEEQFQSLFDQGCREYQHRNLDLAYIAWNEAMSIAVAHKNREWSAVLTTNLQHLTYEIFVQDGKAKLEGGLLEDADRCFERAHRMATKAKNAHWQSEMVRARQSVKCAVFYKCHKAALLMLNDAKAVQDRPATENDFYILPSLTAKAADAEAGDESGAEAGDKKKRATSLKSAAAEPGARRIQHTQAFVNEWPRVRLVWEAVGLWVDAAKVAKKVGTAAQGSLLDVLHGALNQVAMFLMERHFDRTEPHHAVSWQGCSRFTYHECIKLSELYTDMVCYHQQHLRHELFCCVLELYLGNLALATYDLPLAHQKFSSALRAAKRMNVGLLEATALTYSATVNIQRANYALAERELLEARLHWENAIPQEGTNGDAFFSTETYDTSPLSATTQGNTPVRASASSQQAARGAPTAGYPPPKDGEEKSGSSPIPSPRLDAAEALQKIVPRTSLEAVLEAMPAGYATVMANAGNGMLVALLASTYRYQEALEMLEYGLLHRYHDLLLDKMRVNFSGRPSLGQLVGVAGALRSHLVYYFISHRYVWSVDKEAYEMEESVLLWVVPRVGEMRFVELNVTQEHQTTVEALVRRARTGMLVDPPTMSGEEDAMVLDTHRMAWIQPLERLHAVLLDPIASYIKTLELPYDPQNIVITLIPTGSLWTVPFNALINRHGRFAVEDFAIQLGFCATQVHFATVSAERVRERNLQRSLIVQQVEMPNRSPCALRDKSAEEKQNPAAAADTNVPCDYIRSCAEAKQILETIRDERAARVAAAVESHNAAGTDPGALLTPAEQIVEDLPTTRAVAPCARTIHLAVATSYGRQQEADGSIGALHIPMYRTEERAAYMDVLTASEISHMELFTEVVTMSCTAIGVEENGLLVEDALGVARAFLSAGTPCVVLGQWCTPDMFPVEIFSRFYKLLCRHAASSVTHVGPGGVTGRMPRSASSNANESSSPDEPQGTMAGEATNFSPEGSAHYGTWDSAADRRSYSRAGGATGAPLGTTTTTTNNNNNNKRPGPTPSVGGSTRHKANYMAEAVRDLTQNSTAQHTFLVKFLLSPLFTKRCEQLRRMMVSPPAPPQLASLHRPVLFMDNGAYNIKAMLLRPSGAGPPEGRSSGRRGLATTKRCRTAAPSPSSSSSSAPVPLPSGWEAVLLTLPHGVGASPYAGRGLVGAETLRQLPHYHSLLLRRPCTRRGGFLQDPVLEACVWEYVLERFAIQDEEDVDLWLTVPFGACKGVARQLHALVRHFFHFRSLTLVSSTFLALVAAAAEAGAELEDLSSPFQQQTSQRGSGVPSLGPSRLLPMDESVQRPESVEGPARRAAGRLRSLQGGCGVVVDAGFSGTTVVPYLDFLPVTTSIVRLDVGGKLLTNRLKEVLSFTQVYLMEDEWLVNHIKERCCFVALRPRQLLRDAYAAPAVLAYLQRCRQKGKLPTLSQHPLWGQREPVSVAADKDDTSRSSSSSSSSSSSYRCGGSDDVREVKWEEKLVSPTHVPPAERGATGSKTASMKAHPTARGVEAGLLGMPSSSEGPPLVQCFYLPSIPLLHPLGDVEENLLRDGERPTDDRRGRKRPRAEASVPPGSLEQQETDAEDEGGLGAVTDTMERLEQLQLLPKVFLQQECIAIPELIFTPGDIGIPQCGLAEAVGAAIFSRGLLARLPLLQRSGVLLQNTIVVGGSSNFFHFMERLERDLRPFLPNDPCEASLTGADMAEQGAAGTAFRLRRPTWNFHVPRSSLGEANHHRTNTEPKPGWTPAFLEEIRTAHHGSRCLDAAPPPTSPHSPAASAAGSLSAAELQPLKGAYLLFADPAFAPLRGRLEAHATLPLQTVAAADHDHALTQAGVGFTPSRSGICPSAAEDPSLPCPVPTYQTPATVEDILECLTELWMRVGSYVSESYHGDSVLWCGVHLSLSCKYIYI